MPDKKKSYTLQPHQKRVLNKLNNPDIEGLLVYHGLGSGKTLTALAAAEQLDAPTDVIVPAALRENFLKEMDKHVDKKLKDLEVRSYNSAVSNPGSKEVGLRIVDEAHNLGRSDSERSKLFDKLPEAQKTLLLTGTPIRNDPSELAPLINALYGGDAVPRDKKKFYDKFVGERLNDPGFIDKWFYGVKPSSELYVKNKRELLDILKDRVDYHNNMVVSKDYPSIKDKTIEVPMSPAQMDVYNEVTSSIPGSFMRKIEKGIPPSKAELRNMNAFLSAARQASDNPSVYDTGGFGTSADDSTKIVKAVESFLSRSKLDPKTKEIVYSNYLDAALRPYAERLKAQNIPYAFITGDVPFKTRKQSVEDYNTGKLRALLLSAAGSEGLDLKGTNLVQILEPHWHDERLNQVIGRAARFKSHEGLPEDKRKVEVERYLATLPPTKIQSLLGLDPSRSSDQYLEMMSEKKKELNDKFLELLRESST